MNQLDRINLSMKAYVLKTKGLNQTAIADRLGISQPTVSRLIPQGKIWYENAQKIHDAARAAKAQWEGKTEEVEDYESEK